MVGFEVWLPTKIIFGLGQISRVGDLTSKYGKNAMLVTGKHHARRTGKLDRVVACLKEAGLETIVFDQAEPNPLSTTVDAGAELAKNTECEVVVGFGGGSAMDTAKAVAIASTNEGGIWRYAGPTSNPDHADPVRALPVIAIPTTSGTGSEANRYAVITNPATKEKPGMGSDHIYPKVSIVDPELMVSMPAEVTASTGIDALSHAIEAYLNRNPTPFSDMLAEEAIRLIAQNLKRAYQNGGDLEARSKMAWASTLAGMAMDKSDCILAHALAHSLGGRLNVPHGKAVAAFLPAVIRFSYRANLKRFGRLSELLGEDVKGLSEEDAASTSDLALQNLMIGVGMDITPLDLGASEDMAQQLVEDAFGCTLDLIKNNPRPVTREDVLQVCKDAMKTVDPLRITPARESVE